MPRNVRNFWLELEVDGSRTKIETGPRSKDGGFTLKILMRREGDIMRPVTITGREQDGRLTLSAHWMGGNPAEIVAVR
jgi:hypothetical protein